MATDDVLVASKPLERGDVIEKGDLDWKGWPRDYVPPNAIRKSSLPTALADYTGRFVNNRLSPKLPVVEGDIVEGNSFLAATLPSGMRAVAINIDQQGAQTAGGFIHEGDRVDVIHTYRDEDAAKAGVPNPMVSETILRNIKVLAIGPNTQDPKSEKVVFGSNATLN